MAEENNVNFLRFVVCSVCLTPAFASQDSPLQKLWEKGEPAYKTTQKEFDSDVVLKGTVVTLRNRGMVVSKDDYPNGFTLTCKWTIRGGDGASYSDVLAIGFHSDGTQAANRPHELGHGVAVKLQAHAALVTIERHRDGSNKPERHVVKSMPRVSKNTTHDVKIVVDKTHYLEVYLDGKKIADLSVGDPSREKGKARIAIYNREPGGGGPQESLLENLVLEPAK